MVLNIYFSSSQMMLFQKFAKFSYQVGIDLPFHVDTNLSEEIIQMLIKIHFHANNRINFVLPETQLPLISQNEQESGAKLMTGIQNNTIAVLDFNRWIHVPRSLQRLPPSTFISI